MKLQKLRHSADDMGEDCIVTHIVNEIDLGGEYTICGRAIPDSDFNWNGWEPIKGGEFQGTIKDCDCKDCKKIVAYFKRLK
jgi:hypothetical protein